MESTAHDEVALGDHRDLGAVLKINIYEKWNITYFKFCIICGICIFKIFVLSFIDVKLPLDWLNVLSHIQVQDGSPAMKAGLEPFFDFILSMGNTRLVSRFLWCINHRCFWYIHSAFVVSQIIVFVIFNVKQQMSVYICLCNILICPGLDVELQP